MSKNQPNNATVIDTCTARLKALKSYVENTKATIAINGEPHKVSDVLAIYQDCLNARGTLATQRATMKATLVTRATAETKRRAADRALKPWVINQFGADSQQAHDFGFPPPKTPVRSLDEKTQAAALGQATRAARHTMGKRQKEAIKGTITVPTAPAAPAVVVQAAPPAASTPSPTLATPSNGAAAAVNGASPQH